VIESSLKRAGGDAYSDPGGCLPAAAADHIGTHDRIRRADCDGLTIALATEQGEQALLVGDVQVSAPTVLAWW
jgi:hypothetical protein